MSDASSVTKSLRERLGGGTEDRLGRALSDLLENPLLTGALGRAFDAREKAAQAQEVAMGALNIPSAADIERLTRRLRSVSYRLEGIEDGVGRLDRALTTDGVEARLSAIEDQLQALALKLDQTARAQPQGSPARASGAASSRSAGAPRGKRAAKSGRSAGKPARSGKAASGSGKAASGSGKAASGSGKAASGSGKAASKDA
jgi:X-X-X-Leu-X-X-Gly heptad repeat protein